MKNDFDKLDFDAQIVEIRKWSKDCPGRCPIGKFLQNVLGLHKDCNEIEEEGDNE